MSAKLPASRHPRCDTGSRSLRCRTDYLETCPAFSHGSNTGDLICSQDSETAARFRRSRPRGTEGPIRVDDCELSPKLGTPDDAAALKKALAIEIPTFIRYVDNSYLLKSPVNVVSTSRAPERLFVERLLQADNAAALKAWVKSPDVGFYIIEYGFQPGGNGRSKRGQFNPDFFLLREDADEVVVVETKADDDTSDINAGKLAFANAYFAKLNELLKSKRRKRRYQFHFLSPQDYDDFFAGLRDNSLNRFVSTLQAALST